MGGGPGHRGDRWAGFYHDGRFPTLMDVLDHYDQHFELGLTDAEEGDLVGYLLSLGVQAS